jgi:hypothetical protein
MGCISDLPCPVSSTGLSYPAYSQCERDAVFLASADDACRADGCRIGDRPGGWPLR